MMIRNISMNLLASYQASAPRSLANTPFSILSMSFSKYVSKSKAKRLPMTTKRAGKGYYKGNRCRREGTIDSKGRFTMDKRLCCEIVVPDLTNFKLKPYVAVGAKKNVKETQVNI